MDLKKLSLIFIACLSLVALALESSAATNKIENRNDTISNYQKIDPALAKRMNEDDKIDVIVILQGEDKLITNDLEVKYQYSLIKGVAGVATPPAIKRLAEDDSVEKIYLDASAHVNFPEGNTTIGRFLNPAENINASKLWEKGIDGNGVTVAVIDSGIDENHPDLADRVVGKKNFVEDESSTDDLLGHGTMVAGIIAGSGEASGGKYKGVAPGASLLNVKVIDSNGNGRISDIIAGIEWALYNGADVLSLSLGGMNLGETNPPITMAADKAMDAGAVVCVAAGNRNNSKLDSSSETGSKSLGSVRGSQLSQQENKDVLYLLVPIVLALPPGLIDSPGDGVKVITVGTSDIQGNVADFSGSGPIRDGRTKPTVVGPGVDVVSTIPPGLERPKYVDIYYAIESGTSLSTPVAAGLAALLLQADPDLTPAGVKAALTRGAIKLNNTQGDQYEEYYQGDGRLDAFESYKFLSRDLCGMEPDRWTAGRWAYLPAGKALYVGLDAGADRPQKKLYALAPQDEDGTTKFVFFTDKERTNLDISVSGDVSDWISLQNLPHSIPANSQKVFSASLAVPNGTLPGIYNGSISIKNNGNIIFTMPVTAQVAEPIEITKGSAIVESTLNESRWHYYYLDVPLGTNDIKARLKWIQGSELDLFMLSPTSEYYSGELKGITKQVEIKEPPSGRWLVAVHSERLSEPENFTLNIERSLIESSPKRLSVDSALPGSTVTTSFEIRNQGPTLDGLEYEGFIENMTSMDFQGSVAHKKVWDSTLRIRSFTSRISAKLDTLGNGNDSQVLFLFENPNGEPVDADMGTGKLGPIEVLRPVTGEWKIRVYGYKVPSGAQNFRIKLTQYTKENWSWISASGPEIIQSDSSALMEASLKIPENNTIHRLDGYIEVSNSNQSFQIPASITVKGPSLGGLRYSKGWDENNDGFYDKLSLGFAINSSLLGRYRVDGILKDCAGNSIERLSGQKDMQKNDTLQIDVAGNRIWETGKCGPLRIEGLMLYNDRGELLDRYDHTLKLEMNPKEFQPPAGYFTGSYENRTNNKKIVVEIGLYIVKPGSYQLTGRLEDDRGEELGKDSVISNLQPGNITLEMDFNPTKFIMYGKNSSLHLRNLTLSLNGTILDYNEEAWTSNMMKPNGFGPGLSATEGGIRRENGTAIIP
ncbi:MAG: S8 family serine peptidase [Methanotrichaceae archaeon]|nr:S8 family serine peptidase [Methanotrichaceae archaeon]